jgi:hypothetical protein
VTGEAPPAEIAYYYPEPYWLAREGSWVKSLLLFFDEIAILLPSYMEGRNVIADPTLAGPIEERGLLRVLEPGSFLDEEAATKLTEAVAALLGAGSFDHLPEIDEPVELSISRMASHRPLGEDIVAELVARGLAKPSEDGVSVPLHPSVRNVYLLLLAQLARETGRRRRLDLHPVSNAQAVGPSLHGLLELEAMPSRGQVVDLDLQVVGIDLDTIPLDEVLDFKRDSAGAHRRYMQNLRSFTLELSLLEAADRDRALAGRRAMLEEEADDLRRRTFKAWRTPKALSGFSLGIAGAAWSVATANPVPAVLAALGAGLGMLPAKAEGSAYSYLFDSSRHLS